jgi:hypothetical protein
MRSVSTLAAAAVLIAGPVQAEAALEQGFAGALKGCEEWVLNPASWADGPAPFLASVGLGSAIGSVATVSPAALPPPPLRVANRYWRINSTPEAGFILVVSDRLPMCHITGGGLSDLQPVVMSVLNASAFQDRWTKVGEQSSGDMVSTVFRSRAAPTFSLTVSHAKAAGQRQDRVQVLATAQLELSN